MIEQQIASAADIARALVELPELADYQIVRAGDHMVEVRCGTATALLAEPALWRDPDAAAFELSRCSGAMTVLFCLARAADMADLRALRARARIFSLVLPTSTEVLQTSLGNSMSLIAMHQRAEERGQVAERYRYELAELVAIAALLNSERDTGRLLGLILEKSRYITGADAGSVYVLIPDPQRADEQLLRFEAAQNESVEVGELKSFTLAISRSSVVGAAVLSKQVINIGDLAELETHNPWGVVHNRSFDERTGYRTRSVLAVPMINHRDDVIGVIQLINKKTAPGRLQQAEDFEQRVVPFDDRSVELCKTLAYQAAIALDNALLYQELRSAFEGFVEASVLAIEARDPPTSGHSRRVADLTVALAMASDRAADPPFAELSFTPDQLKEIEYAGLLHDFGKVGVPENVLLKAEKLYAWDLRQVLLRFDLIRERLRNDALRRQLQAARAGDGRRLSAIDDGLRKQEAYLDLCRETIVKANVPTVLESEALVLLQEIARHTYTDEQGVEQPYLTPAELACLSIRRGSLSEDERGQIESHVAHSFAFLCMIPWGRRLGRIPLIAGAHHEKLDGSGYPKHKGAGEIPIQARMMAISDIFDALTAADRPYKRAMPVERALGILEQEVGQGKLDADLFRLFVEAEVYRKGLKT